MCRRLSCVLATQVLLVFVSVGRAHALPILDCSVTGSANQWVYSYALDNTTGTDNLYWLELAGLAPDPDRVVDAPGGWEPIPYDSEIDWLAAYTGRDLTCEVHPGDELSGFVLHSTVGPGPVAWWAFGCDDEGNSENPSEYSGLTTGPASAGAVPEPCSALLLLMAGAGVAAGCRRRRR